jgi:hypothetical protein
MRVTSIKQRDRFHPFFVFSCRSPFVRFEVDNAEEEEEEEGAE